MPAENNFCHQTYEHVPRADQAVLMSHEKRCNVGQDEIESDLHGVGQQLRRHNVAAVYLVHGTFVGDDALGLLRRLALFFPNAANRLRRMQKQVLDAWHKDRGNYSSQFAAPFELALNDDGQSRIPVRRFHWSSENNHVRRCDAAVRLIAELASREFKPEQRVLLWGHSHGGNVLALVSNLLGASDAARQRFFDAARPVFARRERVIDPVWEEVHQLLGDRNHPLRRLPLDMVTFGTPIRYGWDSVACGQLLHFVNHRPADGLPEYQAAFPGSLDDVMSARYGDVVQQMGIAGSSFAPSILSARVRSADRRLRRVVQSGIRSRDYLSRVKRGVRVHEEGTSLLVDYQPPDDPDNRRLAGHAVYTQLAWLPFHAKEVARRFYGAPVD